MFLNLPFSLSLHILSFTASCSITHFLTLLLTMNPVPYSPVFSSGPLYIRLKSGLSILPFPCHLTSCRAMRSILYFFISAATICIFPGCFKVSTFHVAIVSSFLLDPIRFPLIMSMNSVRVLCQ
uniref:Uncharacterized protein n=1 Tax=Cacopsylla melanoneura TaxID=428564 RepID=A0A8D9BD43_9HEMI